MKKRLFCVHIQGVDDLVPVRSMGEAVRAAAYLNSEYLEIYAKFPDDGLTPLCFVVPAVWPGDDGSHAASLKDGPHWIGGSQ